MGSIPLELRRSEAQSFWRVKDFPKYGSALALRINARQLFSGREPWFRLQARKLIGCTDEVIQQGKVPEGVTNILLQKGQESTHSEKDRLEE